MDILLLFGFIYCLVISTVDGIRCYLCNNSNNPACGLELKTYQFAAYDCPAPNTKCGKQTQMPLGEDTDNPGWVGVIRTCYAPGSLPGINETNGCHLWTNYAANFTALYCFCDSDKCNSADSVCSARNVIVVTSVLSALLQIMQ